MTAKELIEKLSELDPDEIVYVEDTGCGCCSGQPQKSKRIFEAKIEFEYTGELKKVSVIE